MRKDLDKGVKRGFLRATGGTLWDCPAKEVGGGDDGELMRSQRGHCRAAALTESEPDELVALYVQHKIYTQYKTIVLACYVIYVI